MSNIPTAEEWLLNHKEISKYDIEEYDEGGYLGVNENALYKIMIEFAKFHVQAALKAASEKIELVDIKNFEKFYTKQLQYVYDIKNTTIENSDVVFNTKDSILNVYPLKNIK